MHSASIKKTIPCSKKNLIEMVLDIEKYPLFVPWCIDGKIHKKINKGELVEIIADLTIGKNFINSKYQSLVVYNKKKDSISVTSINGPLKFLENKWFFKQVGSSSEVDFYINFELKNKIFNILMKKSFDIGMKKIIFAFEQRAIKLFNRKN